MNKGYLIATVSAFMFASYALTNKFVFDNYDVDTFAYIITFSLTNGSLGMAATLARSDKKKFRRKNFKEVVFVSLIAIAALSLFVFAQSKTTATNASVLITLVVVSTAVWSVPMLKHKLTKTTYIWMPIMLAGVYIVIAGLTKLQLNAGDALVIASVALFGLVNTYTKRLIPDFGSEFIVNFRLALGAVTLLVAGLLLSSNGVLVTNAGLWPVAAGVLSYLNIMLTFKAMHYISATNSLVINMSQVVIAMIGAWLLFDEHLTILKLVGAVVVVYSAYRIVRPVAQTKA